jgi:hypothetical protein
MHARTSRSALTQTPVRIASSCFLCLHEYLFHSNCPELLSLLAWLGGVYHLKREVSTRALYSLLRLAEDKGTSCKASVAAERRESGGR